MSPRPFATVVVGLGLAELVAWGTLYYAFSALVVPMSAELGWSPAVSTGAFALGVALSGVAGVLVGRRIARRGAHGVMVVGALVGAGALAAWSAVARPWEFFLAFCAVGVAMSATLYEPAFAVLAAVGRGRRHAGVVVVTALGGLGGAVFVPLTGQLVGHLGWRGTLHVLALAVAALAVGLHLLLRTVGPPAPAADADPAPDPGAGRSPAIRWLTVSITLASGVKAGLVVDLVALLVARGHTLALASLAAGSAGVTQVLGRLFTASARRFPEHRVTAVVCAAQACAAVPLIATTPGSPAEPWAVGTYVLVTGMGFGLPELLRGTWLVDLAGARDYPRVNGRVALPVGVARAAGPLLVGLAVTLTGGHTAVVAGGALVALVAGVAALRAGAVGIPVSSAR